MSISPKNLTASASGGPASAHAACATAPDAISPQPSAANRGQTPSRRDFANVLDASLMMLRAIGFPLKRRQNIVSAIQGKAGGRLAFAMSHLTLARSMQHAGSEEAARAYVRRELDGLEAFQHRTGYRLFEINRGGGVDHERTSYEDFLTPAAAWAVETARGDREAWAAHPGKALAARIPDAVARLPRFDAEPLDTLEPGSTFKTPPGVRIARDRKHSLTRACSALETVRDHGGDVVGFASELAREIMERAHLIAGEEWAADLAAEFEAGEGTKVLHLLSPPLIRTEEPEPVEVVESEREIEAEAEPGGLQICHPPGEEAQENEPYLPGLFDVAVAYAACGWRVFPLHAPDAEGRCSCARPAECKSVGKHPRTARGVKEATTDVEQIFDWWEKWPDANIGIATGAESGLVVLDIDPRHGGDVSLAELMEKHGDLPHTMEAMTGGGGWHVFFKHPGVAFKNSASVLGQGLDVKTDGGYVVVSPSVHASGRFYAWRESGVHPAEMPAWLVELLTAPRQISRTATGAPARASGNGHALDSIISEGSRNDALFRRVACRLRGQGAGYAEIMEACLEANARLCSPPLPESEVRKVAASAMRYHAGLRS